MIGILLEPKVVIDSSNIQINPVLTVTVSGKPNVDVPIGTLKNIWRQAQLEED